MIAERKPRKNPGVIPLDFVHGDGEQSLTSTASVYTRKSTLGFIFVLGGGPICTGASVQALTAQSTMEAELVVATRFGGNEVCCRSSS